MTIEEVKQQDLQKAVKDINAVLGTKQNHVSGRQVLIDFIVSTIGGCIGPNPDDPEEQIWTNDKAGGLKPETLTLYEVLTAPAGADPAPAKDAEQVVAKAEAVFQAGETTEAPQTKECPEFGKGYDAAEPACAKPCKRAEECAELTAQAAAAAPTGRKPRKTAEEKEAEKQAKAAEREAKKQERAAARAANKTPGTSKPGVIAAIFEMVKAGPHSKEEILTKLITQFPDRSADSMKATVNVQLPNRMSKDKGVKIIRDDNSRYSIQG